MARNKKHINDKFYTSNEVANKMLSLIDLTSYDLIIEPSAGDGSFSNLIENVIALDIDPENPNITKMDWFEYTTPIGYKNILVVGNPPFGNQGGLAMKFIKKSIDIGSNTIAFVLPKSFKKESIKSKIPLNYHLEKEVDIDDNSFILEGKSYNVPCVFQVWSKKDYNREVEYNNSTTDMFTFVKKDQPHDIAFRRVGFYAGRTYLDTLEKSEQSHYFISSNIDVDKLRDIFDSIKWEHNNTAGPRSIGKKELVNRINQL